jgi:hypothetical protein
MDAKARRVLALVMMAAIITALPAVVVAQGEPGDEIPPCERDAVAGTVVDVDEAGMVTVETEAGQCTVILEGEYEHPTYGLIGSYFGDVSAGELREALEALQVWAMQDEEGEWSWSDEEEGTAATVLSVVDDEDGTYSVTLAVEGLQEPVDITTEEAELADRLAVALETLGVAWRLKVDDEGGASVVEIADDIGVYHEDGIGFGVLVKVYAIAAESAEACEAEEGPCGASVEELVEALQSGTGMGQLFEQYGKPSVLGVGHLRDREGNEEPATIQEAFRAEMEACRAEFHETRESLRAQRKALQEQIRELARSDAEDAEERREQLQAELEAVEAEIEALEAAYEECLGDAELAKDEAMAGLDLDGDDENGGGRGKDKKPKDKVHGMPDHAQGWGPGGNPEESGDE